MLGVFPDYPAPVIRNTDTGIEMALVDRACSRRRPDSDQILRRSEMTRWAKRGLPSEPPAVYPCAATVTRAIRAARKE
jgi:hypothetical protein